MRDGKITARWAFSDDTERIVAFFWPVTAESLRCAGRRPGQE